ncbi:GAP family protein [Clavibacter michiganensis]|uniref:GAP family protein n=1 Tax=Clavibacter michiganensis TaxID=28447 RepID=UPI002930FF5B|nr:GAP family protein [Clavibacter michiganensis]
MTLSMLGLALLDSLNPSAIVVSLLIVVARFDDRRRMAASLLAYAAGITVAMVGVGVALMLGLRVLIDQVLRDVPERALDVAQLVVGVIILLIGALTPAKPKRARRPLDLDRGAGRLFVLGLGVTVVELSSALPYLAAVGILTSADLPPVQWVAWLVAYSAVVVLPVVLILLIGLATASREGAREWAAKRADSMRQAGRGLILTILFLLGLFLTADAVTRLGVFDGLPGA